MNNEVFDYWKNNIKNKKIVKLLQKNNEKINFQAFSTYTTFGTAGLRGKMELGTNAMNEIIVCKLAQAICEFMRKNKKKKVSIGYDTRNNSQSYAKIFAKVCEQNKMRVLLFEKFCPTPILVYSINFYNADLGIMITASHNRKEYNGIKVYNCEAMQISGEEEKEISNLYNNVNEVEVYNKAYLYKLKKVKKIKNEVANDFLKNCNNIYNENSPSLKIVYTPLNGTGRECVIGALISNFGYPSIPSSQKHANGNFKTCPYPNPEFEETFAKAIKLAKRKKADIIIATDPDADRLGVMCRDNGNYIKLTGNEVGLLMLDYFARMNNTQNGYAVTSVVTSTLFDKMCKRYAINGVRNLTGFKNLAVSMKEMEKKFGKDAYIFSYEESCGYICRKGIYDKDGIYAALTICRIAQECKNFNKTLIDRMKEIYSILGNVYTLCDNIMFEQNNGIEKMQKVVNELRSNKPQYLGEEEITNIIDYEDSEKTHLEKSNFLQFETVNSTFFIRPSGTEPKLKIYIHYKDQTMDKAKKNAENLLKQIKKEWLKI